VEAGQALILPVTKNQIAGPASSTARRTVPNGKCADAGLATPVEQRPPFVTTPAPRSHPDWRWSLTLIAAREQTPIALLGALFTSSPATAIGGVRLLARNLPLVLLLVMIGSLFWPTQPEEDSQEAGQRLKPNGADEMPSIRH
jgi:hypothetical protein